MAKRRRDPNRNGALSMRLAVFNDRDLLYVVHDLAGQDGYADTDDVAERVFGVSKTAEREVERFASARRCVSVRFSWMARYGVLEKNPAEKHLWRLTGVGEAARSGVLPSGLRRSIEEMGDVRLLHLMHAVAGRYQTANQVAATLMRREWLPPAGEEVGDGDEDEDAQGVGAADRDSRALRRSVRERPRHRASVSDLG